MGSICSAWFSCKGKWGSPSSQIAMGKPELLDAVFSLRWKRFRPALPKRLRVDVLLQPSNLWYSVDLGFTWIPQTSEHCFSVNRTHSCGRSPRYLVKEFIQSCLQIYCDNCRRKLFSKVVLCLNMLKINHSGSGSRVWTSLLNQESPSRLS